MNKSRNDMNALRARAHGLAERDWDLAAIEARYAKLLREGIPKKNIVPAEIISRKQEILDRVQRRGEEYEYLTMNCAKGAALAVMEEFGLGSLDMLKGLHAFPGMGMKGYTCGPIAGGLFVLGLYFGSDDISDFVSLERSMMASRQYMSLFEEEVGTVLCPNIQEMIFGQYFDPRASQENREAFLKAGGREQCALLPGIGARLIARLIIESMDEQTTA
jgi:hypothetical protein